MGRPTQDVKNKAIKKLNGLMGAFLFYENLATNTEISCFYDGVWEIEKNYQSSRMTLRVMDIERSDSPVWKIVWDIIKDLEVHNG